jgi:hypothetical protein
LEFDCTLKTFSRPELMNSSSTSSDSNNRFI